MSEGGVATNGAMNGNAAVMDQSQTKPQEITKPAPQRLVVQDTSELSYLMDTARYEQVQRLATAMGRISFLPDHLALAKNGQRLPDLVIAANCVLIINQALRWGVDPYALAPETYVVGGKLGYQGKLVAAIVNAKAGLKGRLKARYSGKGDDRTVEIIGQFADEEEPRTISLSVAQARTTNQMWTKDPDQKLWYSGVTKWARRHCPEVLLGILTDDDVDAISERERAERSAQQGSKADQLKASLQGMLANSGPEIVDSTATAIVGQIAESDPDPAVTIEERIAKAKRVTDLHAIGTELNDMADIQEILRLGELIAKRQSEIEAARKITK